MEIQIMDHWVEYKRQTQSLRLERAGKTKNDHRFIGGCAGFAYHGTEW